jgi:hypothetical protein
MVSLHFSGQVPAWLESLPGQSGSAAFDLADGKIIGVISGRPSFSNTTSYWVPITYQHFSALMRWRYNGGEAGPVPPSPPNPPPPPPLGALRYACEYGRVASRVHDAVFRETCNVCRLALMQAPPTGVFGLSQQLLGIPREAGWRSAWRISTAHHVSVHARSRVILVGGRLMTMVTTIRVMPSS